MSFGSANYLLHEEGVADLAAAPSKPFLMHLMGRIIHCQNKTRIGDVERKDSKERIKITNGKEMEIAENCEGYFDVVQYFS